MKKNLFRHIYLFLLIFISYQILTHSSIVIKTVIDAIDIWKNNLFPPMFTFFICSELLINYGFIDFIGYILGKPFRFLFNIDKNGVFVIIMSLLSGFPSSAKYIRELYIQNKIKINDANRLILFTHFSNPLFVLGTISYTIFNNRNIGIIILVSHYLGNFVIGLITRPKTKNNYEKCKLEIEIKEKNFILVLTRAINNSINTLLLILGIITTCMIITNILNNHINNEIIKLIANSTFEMTKGINNLKCINMSTLIKGVLATMIISFGGISVHMQVSSILSDTKIKYMPFLIARIFHSIISGIIFIIIFNLMY